MKNYSKMIIHGKIIELYEYEKNIEYNGRPKREIQSGSTMQNLDSSREDIARREEQKKTRRKDNAMRAKLAFNRLVSANLRESEDPLLITLTYAKNQMEIGQAHKDFNSFARRFRQNFKNRIRYIVTSEFQKRGSIHFHGLFWGLNNEELKNTERRTRLVAGLWGHGFVDLIATDGNEKLIGYLSKYMSKAFVEPRLFSKKAYIASRNIIRPEVIKYPLLLPYFWSGLDHIDLSTAKLLTDTTYMTKWLGQGRYKKYKLT